MKTKTTPHEANQEAALASFCHHIANARELMTRIQQHLDDHMGVGPEEITWGHCGNAAHVVEELQDLARFLNLKD